MRPAIAAVLLWTASVTIIRASRWPNDFAEAHWLLDYRFGFIRRGLVGEVVRRIARVFGAPLSETLVSTLAAIVFVLLSVAVGIATVRILRRSRWAPECVLALLAFLASPFVVMGAHFMGYLDHVVFVLTIAAIGLVLRGHLGAGAALQSLAVFVHESSIVMGVPAWSLALWQSARQRNRSFAVHFWPLLPLAAFAVVALADRAQHQEDLRERLTRRLARVEFVRGDMHVFVPEWLSESFSENLAVHSRHFVNRVTSAPMYVLAVPSIVALLAAALARFRPRAPVLAAAVAVVLAPLVLHLAAFDTARIWTFTIAGAFLAMWVLAETHSPVERGPILPSLLAAAAIVSNVLITSPLMDGLSERFSLGVRVALYVPALFAVAYFLGDRTRRRAF